MNGSIQIYYGDGRGKTTAALGLGIRSAGKGQKVIMIQFLKSKNSDVLDFLKRLEPEMQIFRFERATTDFYELTEEQQKEQITTIRNAILYTRKVVATGQCDLLILDEVLGLIDYDILKEEELVDILERKDDSMKIVLTGRHLPTQIAEKADCVYFIHIEKEDQASVLG